MTVSPADAHTPEGLRDAETEPDLQELGPGVAALVQLDGSWGLSNAGLIWSDDVVVLVDTWFTERRNTLLREMVLATAGRPPTMLVNTHHHGDHVYGNGWFPEALVFSHVSTREAVLRLDPGASARRFTTVEFGETRATPAAVTFDDGLRLHAGELTVEVFYPGVAHCAGNAAVFVPERSVLFAGDLALKGCTPALVGGSALGYLRVLDDLRAREPQWVVPGHGPTCGPEVFDETERYVRYVLATAAAALSAGQTAFEAAQQPLPEEFAGWHDSERIVGNLHRAMFELDPQRPADEARPVDMAAMWRDTEAWLGRALHSRA